MSKHLTLKDIPLVAQKRAIESAATHIVPYGDTWKIYAPSPHNKGCWVSVYFDFFDDVQKWLMYGSCHESSSLPDNAVLLEQAVVEN